MAQNAAPFGSCPQCRTQLQQDCTETGRPYRRCPRCGWNDRDFAGVAAPVEDRAPQPAADGETTRKKKSSCGCVVAAFFFLLITGIVVTAIMTAR